MKNAIGVIDSGVGGLTVLYELIKQLPNENYVYIGDTLRCPYGAKSKEQVKKYVFEIVDYLLDKNIKCLVIACNTATAYTIKELKEKLSIPVIGVIKPGARAAIKSTRNNNIGVIGTVGTINSHAYTKVLKSIAPSVNVYSLACPKFVPMIEKGTIKGKEAEQQIYSSLQPFFATEIDTLILGCTHYPIIKDTIQSVLGSEIKIVSSAEETARELKEILDNINIFENPSNNNHSNIDLYTTGDLKSFIKLTNLIFNKQVNNNKVKFKKAIFN